MADSNNESKVKKNSTVDTIIPDLGWIKKSRDDVPPRDPNTPIPENPLLALKRKLDVKESKPPQSGE
jgi:hypothetical protein